MDIKPIETFYNGYRFRSRLEARWAVFFDAIGIKYLYEPEGYRLSDGTCYLPDFYLPEMNSFFEVKGELKLTDERKIKQFISETKQPVTIGFDDFTFTACSDYRPDYYHMDFKNQSVLAKCNKCNKYFFTGISGSWECQCCGYYNGDGTADWLIDGADSDLYVVVNKEESERVKKAIVKAKRARFEHGECGK